jgi:hypothetical protein
MNARYVLNWHLNHSPEEIGEFVRKECQKLQDLIFSIMPAECFLKKLNHIGLQMVFMLSPKMIEKGMVSRKDICSLCSATTCPFNNVRNKNLRGIKIKVLGLFYNQ